MVEIWLQCRPVHESCIERTGFSSACDVRCRWKAARTDETTAQRKAYKMLHNSQKIGKKSSPVPHSFFGEGKADNLVGVERPTRDERSRRQWGKLHCRRRALGCVAHYYCYKTLRGRCNRAVTARTRRKFEDNHKKNTKRK